MIYTCPICHSPLEPDDQLLRCPRDGYTNAPLNGIRDLMSDEERRRNEPFVEEYVGIRRAEGRGFDRWENYLDLPFSKVPGGEPGAEWDMRAESMMWLWQLLEREVPAYQMPHIPAYPEPIEPHVPRRVLDAGAGNCWLTRHLAHWGYESIALDLQIDERDGLPVGRYYLEHLPITFERVRADFARLPFVDESFDAVVFNGSLHYAEDLERVVREAMRVTRSGGVIVALDSPIYRERSSGEKMLSERAIRGRASYFTHQQLKELSRSLGMSISIDFPDEPIGVAALKKRITELRLGRETARMGRVVMKIP